MRTLINILFLFLIGVGSLGLTYLIFNHLDILAIMCVFAGATFIVGYPLACLHDYISERLKL